MSLHSRIGQDAAPALRLEALPEFERRVIRLLRLWRTGPAGVAEARLTAGPRVCARIEALARHLAAPGLRPLRFAAPGARTLLGDECVLARVVSLAAEGAAEEAALTCGLAIHADRGDRADRAGRAHEAARLAGELGAALLAAPEPPRRPAHAYLIAGRPVTPKGDGGR